MAAPWKWWTAIAATLLVVGAGAWILKLLSGAEGARFDLGFYSLLVGSTGLGVRLTANRGTTVRDAAVVVSMAAFFLSFSLLSALVDEAAGILISALVWLAIGLALLFGSVPELMANMPPAPTILSKSRMLFMVLFMVAVIAVGLFGYYNNRAVNLHNRVAADEVACGADHIINVGAASPYCARPAPGEGIMICKRPPGAPSSDAALYDYQVPGTVDDYQVSVEGDCRGPFFDRPL